jgi:glycosyltransferase involved in cell wall biosynthesis
MSQVSVIIPNYNHARFLDERIGSILEQDYRDCEILILDDCSEDGSREIISRYQRDFPRIKIHFNTANSGSPFRQWNLGVQMTTGEFIWIAESDDYAHPCFLSETVPILERNPKAGLVFARSLLVDEYSRGTGAYGSYRPCAHNYVAPGRQEIADYLCWYSAINNVSGVLFRRSAYIYAGMADPSMRFCGDWDLYLRILLIADVAHVTRPLNYCRAHSGSSSHEYFRDADYFEEVLSIYEFVKQSSGLPHRMKRQIAHQCAGFLAGALVRGYLPSLRLLRRISRLDVRFGMNAAVFLLVKAKSCYNIYRPA